MKFLKKILPIAGMFIIGFSSFTVGAESVQEMRAMQLIRSFYVSMLGCEGIEAISGYPGDCSAELVHEINLTLTQMEEQFSKSDWRRIIYSPDYTKMLKVHKRLQGIAADTEQERAERKAAYEADEARKKATREAEREAKEKARKENERRYQAKKKRDVIISKAKNNLSAFKYEIDSCRAVYNFYGRKKDCMPTVEKKRIKFYTAYNKLTTGEKDLNYHLWDIDYVELRYVQLTETAAKHEAQLETECEKAKGFLAKIGGKTYFQKVYCKD